MTALPAPLAAVLSDRYRVEREIARGGMSTVYLAEDVRHGRQVAIKVVQYDALGPAAASRFLREIAIATRLQHPHIIALHDSGEVTVGPGSGPGSGGATRVLYYVMPYVGGETLRQLLARDGPLPIGLALGLLRDVADALAHAHEHGVVHRDIKPENVMVTDGRAVVADFGVAKALRDSAERPGDATAVGPSYRTTAGFTVGTPAYMSPEQVTADSTIDHRSDIYSFGVLAYEILTGQPPFVAPTAQGVLAGHVMMAPAPISTRRPDVPEALGSLVMRCLEKEPAKRWQSAGEIVGRLESIAGTSEGPARGSRRRVVLVAIALAVAALAIIAVILWLTRPPAAPA